MWGMEKITIISVIIGTTRGGGQEKNYGTDGTFLQTDPMDPPPIPKIRLFAFFFRKYFWDHPHTIAQATHNFSTSIPTTSNHLKYENTFHRPLPFVLHRVT